MLDHPTPTISAAPKKPRKKPRIIVWTRFAVRVMTFLLLPILFIDTSKSIPSSFSKTPLFHS